MGGNTRGWHDSLSDTYVVKKDLLDERKNQFYELDEISIQYKNSQYHFSLPIPNSVYSYYKKFTHGNNDTNTEIALHFLKSYTNTLTSYLY